MGGGIFFPPDPGYKGVSGQPAPANPPQDFLRSILSGFGLFSTPAPVYATAPTTGGGGTSTGGGQLPPGGGLQPGASVQFSSEIVSPAIQKDGGEKYGEPVVIPWPKGAVRYRVHAFSPVYPGTPPDTSKDASVQPQQRGHSKLLNASPIGINVPARGELPDGAMPPTNLTITPTWQCVGGTVAEGAIACVFTVEFFGRSTLPKGSN